MDTKSWFVIYTKSRWEKKVYASLLEQGIPAYCPLNKTVRQWSDRKKTVEVPLFSSYVFVQIVPEEQLKVRMTPGVVNFVYWLGKIARVRNGEMEELQRFVAQHQNIRVQKLNYNKGDKIEIESGLLKGQRAIIGEVRKNKLELILESMNVKLVVDYVQSVAG